MNAMVLRTVCLVLVLIWSAGTYAQIPLGATFEAPVFHHSDNNACHGDTTKTQLSPDKRELSILFPGYLVEVGQNRVAKPRGSCVFDLIFSKKLRKPETVRIDIRGSEMKDVSVRLEYTISLGEQTHHFDYDKGRIIESSDSGHSNFIRRFELTDIPIGTRKVRMSFQGKGKSNTKDQFGYVAIDTLDVCIASSLDHDQLECGGTIEKLNRTNNRDPALK